ncbi:MULTISPECIES: GNAT family N-acetyltransferase [Priestia]|uniref:GNAT family N-acetyltransferase n=1 Tax=Priestia TaxID=2800373 RepID=UPI00112882F1|nr:MULTISPECIES: GNAT family N-acetyltransferase [Priestia]
MRHSKRHNNLFLISEFKDNPVLFDYHKEKIYESLATLNKNYPEFKTWYYDKIIPGIQNGQREIIMTYDDKLISGISILKNTHSEKKICTLRVSSNYRKNGIGKILFEKSLDILNSDSPIITISENKIHQFRSLLNYYGFELSQVIPGCYVDSQDEYVYNGALTNTKTPLLLQHN